MNFKMGHLLLFLLATLFCCSTSSRKIETPFGDSFSSIPKGLIYISAFAFEFYKEKGTWPYGCQTFKEYLNKNGIATDSMRIIDNCLIKYMKFELIENNLMIKFDEPGLSTQLKIDTLDLKNSFENITRNKLQAL